MVLLGSCATAGTFQTAAPVGPGGWEVGGDLSALTIVSAEANNPTLPLPRGVVRVGLGERWELGGSLGLDGARAYGKVRVTRPGAGVIVSLAPGVRVLPLPFGQTGTGGLAGLEQAVLVGFPVTDHSQGVLTARVAGDIGRIDGRTAALAYAGGTGGWSFRLGDAFRLHPELGVMVPVFVADDQVSAGPQGLFVQAGLGIVWGHRRPAVIDGLPGG